MVVRRSVILCAWCRQDKMLEEIDFGEDGAPICRSCRAGKLAKEEAVNGLVRDLDEHCFLDKQQNTLSRWIK